MNTADELQKLYALHQAGALSDEEYAEAKAKLLAGSLSHPAATTPERQQELRHWAMVLHLSLLAAGVGPGDEVVTPALTFCSAANAVLHTGATPVLADVKSLYDRHALVAAGFNVFRL